MHLLVLPVLVLAFLTGWQDRFLEATLAVVLHEGCHAVTAKALGYQIACVELLPFGGVAKMVQQDVSPTAEFTIALAGPVCSFVTAAALSAAMRVFPATGAYLSGFFQINMALAAINLLPALPLDGGKMLRALLEKRKRGSRVGRVIAWSGVLFGALLSSVGVWLLHAGVYNISLLLFGLFLLLSAVRELRMLPEHRLHGMLKRQDAIDRGEQVPIHHCVMLGSVRAGDVLPLIPENRYTLIRVLRQGKEPAGELSEKELISGITKYGSNVTLEELLQNAFSR